MALIFDTVLLDLIFLACTLIGYVYYKIQRRLKYFTEQGIPSVLPSYPWEFNSAGIFEEKSLCDKLHELYEAFDGCKYGGYFSFYQPTLLIRDRELITRILTTDFSHFNDHGLPVNPEVDFLNDNIFFQAGWKWRALRKRMSPTFTSGKLKNMTPLIDTSMLRFLKYLDERNGTDFELKDTLSKLTIDVIASCAFGVESQTFEDEDSQLKEMGMKVFNPSVSQRIKTVLFTVVPKLFTFFKIPVDNKEINEFFKSFVKQTFDHRKKSGVKRNDFIDLLIQLKETGSVDIAPEDQGEIEEEVESIENIKLEMTDEILTAQSFLFFIAGHETSATAMTFILYLLSKNSDKQSKAREEVRRAKEQFGSINYEAVKSMSYLNACISEGMRIYPTIPSLPRVCTKDYVMEDGFVVKKGVRVTIPIYSIHHDPKYFPNPESFLPERFLGGESIQPGTYLPFGDGPRICLAKRFALLEMQIALAYILDNYEVVTSPKMIEPLTLANQLFVTVAKGGTWITFRKISK